MKITTVRLFKSLSVAGPFKTIVPDSARLERLDINPLLGAYREGFKAPALLFMCRKSYLCARRSLEAKPVRRIPLNTC